LSAKGQYAAFYDNVAESYTKYLVNSLLWSKFRPK
jgi:hypothetical protein